MNDIIVVGSGASGVHAALPLAEAGLRVLLLDVGNDGADYRQMIPAEPFEKLRRSDTRQHRWLLGEEWEGVPLGPVRVGAQLTPPRQHIHRLADRVLGPRRDAGAFHAMESLAFGGLAAGWGAGAFPFTDADLRGWPIRRSDLQEHYESVARIIGVCGSSVDDLAPYFGSLPGLLPAARADSNGETLRECYERKRVQLRQRGLHAGDPWLAMATERLGDRGPLRYLDMEFWADADRAVYRPRYTTESLRKLPNVQVEDDALVERFDELADGSVTVDTRCTKSDARRRFEGKRLVLAAGTLGSARIVLRSLQQYGVPVSLLSNAYTYYPSLNLRMMGKPMRDRRHSLTQFMAVHDPHGDGADLVTAQAYSYRSLLLFKLLKETPLPLPQARMLQQTLQNWLVILGVHHADYPAPTKRLWVDRQIKDPDATLHVRYEPTDTELLKRASREKEVLRLLRKLGCLPIGSVHPGEGASIHYGGTFPMTRDERPLTTTPEGRLRGTQSVWMADGSGFPTLPAKGLTFTLMANARRVAMALLRERR